MPPVNSSLPASAKHMAVMGKSVGMNVTASFVLVSQIWSRLVLRPASHRSSCPSPTYANVTVVRATDEHLLATLAHVHAVDDLFVAGVSPYALAGLDVPARQVHVCRRREQHLGVSRPMQIQDGLLVSTQDSVVLTCARTSPEH
jgi:hypothetical protein